MAERIRLIGIAKGPAGVLVKRTVVADDQGAFGRIDSLEPFDLELPDGVLVRVHPTKDVRIEPLTEKKMKWGEIEGDPSFASIRERGPGPYVTVVVKRSEIVAGERVALSGEEKDFAFDEAGGTPRAAPKRQLTAVTADVLAGGADAEEILAHVLETPDAIPGQLPKRKKKEKSEQGRKLRSYVTVPRVLGLVGVASGLLANSMRFSPAKLDFVFIAILMFATGMLIAAWRTVPRFVRGKDVVEDVGGGLVGISVLGLMAVVTMALLAFISDVRYAWTPPPAAVEEPNASWLVGPAALGYLVVLAVILFRSSRRRASLLATILDAPRFTALPDETRWGSVSGVVRDPTPVKVSGGNAALANVIQRDVRPGSDPDIVTESVLNEGTFFIDSDVGTFEIDPSGATWASSVRMVTTDTEKKHVFADVVVIGGHIVVAGRAVTPAKGEPARFVEGRADSLVFYATGRDEDARTKARMHQWRRLAAIGTLVLGACAIGGLMAIYEPELPAFHVEGGE